MMKGPASGYLPEAMAGLSDDMGRVIGRFFVPIGSDGSFEVEPPDPPDPPPLEPPQAASSQLDAPSAAAPPAVLRSIAWRVIRIATGLSRGPPSWSCIRCSFQLVVENVFRLRGLRTAAALQPPQRVGGQFDLHGAALLESHGPPVAGDQRVESLVGCQTYDRAGRAA